MDRWLASTNEVGADDGGSFNRFLSCFMWFFFFFFRKLTLILNEETCRCRTLDVEEILSHDGANQVYRHCFTGATNLMLFSFLSSFLFFLLLLLFESSSAIGKLHFFNILSIFSSIDPSFFFCISFCFFYSFIFLSFFLPVHFRRRWRWGRRFFDIFANIDQIQSKSDEEAVMIQSLEFSIYHRSSWECFLFLHLLHLLLGDDSSFNSSRFLRNWRRDTANRRLLRPNPRARFEGSMDSRKDSRRTSAQDSPNSSTGRRGRRKRRISAIIHGKSFFELKHIQTRTLIPPDCLPAMESTTQNINQINNNTIKSLSKWSYGRFFRSFRFSDS